MLRGPYHRHTYCTLYSAKGRTRYLIAILIIQKILDELNFHQHKPGKDPESFVKQAGVDDDHKDNLPHPILGKFSQNF